MKKPWMDELQSQFVFHIVGEVLCEIGEVCTKSNVEKVARQDQVHKVSEMMYVPWMVEQPAKQAPISIGERVPVECTNQQKEGEMINLGDHDEVSSHTNKWTDLF
jgi:hypothetical protein